MKYLYTLITLLITSLVYSQGTVTMRMDSQGSNPTNVAVVGDFNGWNATSNPMTDANSDGIYEIDLTITSDRMQFKFVVDGVWEAFDDGDVGTITSNDLQYTNRYLPVEGTKTTVAYPYNAPYATGDKNVTFRVDYSNSATTFTTANINGNFNGWCGGCNPMTDDDGDGIWEATLPLAAGVYEMKFTQDGWTNQEYFNGVDHPGVIHKGNNYNRYLNVDSDMTVTAVYQTASVLSFDEVKSIDNIKVSLYPNPVNNIANISADESIDDLRVYDITGRVIIQHTPNKTDFRLNVSDLSKGVYLVKINSGNREATTKLIK